MHNVHTCLFAVPKQLCHPGIDMDAILTLADASTIAKSSPFYPRTCIVGDRIAAPNPLPITGWEIVFAYAHLQATCHKVYKMEGCISTPGCSPASVDNTSILRHSNTAKETEML